MQHVAMTHSNVPWNLSFSFGRALQHSCLRAWGGVDGKAGHIALLERARANSEASCGLYSNLKMVYQMNLCSYLITNIDNHKSL